VYLATNAGYARVLGWSGLASAGGAADMVATRAARATLGEVGGRWVAALVFVSCAGGCMSSLLTGSRMLVPMATDGLFPRSLGAVSARTHIPARAVLVGATLGATYVGFRSFEQLTNAFVVGYFPFYGLAAVAVVVLRRREPELVRPFRVPGYPWVPLSFVAGAGLVIAGGVADADRSAWLAAGVVALGLCVHTAWTWARGRTLTGA
jgi:amino acid transporter